MGAVYHDSPETLLALMLALPAQVVVGHTPPVIEEEGKLQLPFLAHSRHSASYHRKSAHFSRNNGNSDYFAPRDPGLSFAQTH